MPRPRMHGDRTREALLDAAEALVADAGPHALSVRAVADAVGTSTRAVYSVLGGKGGLLGALAGRTFLFLRDALDGLPLTDDPERDLIDAGVIAYRGFVRDRPALYRITFQRVVPGLELNDALVAARAEAFGRLELRVQRLEDAGGLVAGDVRAAAVQFNALCEGLANAELRGGTLQTLPAGEEVRAWSEAFATLVRGFATPPRA